MSLEIRTAALYVSDIFPRVSKYKQWCFQAVEEVLVVLEEESRCRKRGSDRGEEYSSGKKIGRKVHLTFTVPASPRHTLK